MKGIEKVEEGQLEEGGRGRGWENVLGASCVSQTSPTQNMLAPMMDAKYGLWTTLSV